MSKDLNKCMFIGRLGRDVEMKYTASGTAIANIAIACGDDYKDKQTGQKVEKTEWVQVSAFGRLAEIMGEYLAKGSKVYIEGKYTTRKWQDDEGKDRYTTSINASEMQMLDSRADPQQGNSQTTRQQAQAQKAPAQNQAPPQQAPASTGRQQQQAPESNDESEDIPF